MFCESCPPVWQLHRAGTFHQGAQHHIITQVASGWASAVNAGHGGAAEGCSREEPPLPLTWGFWNIYEELQLQEWKNCVTAQAWLSQKCQHFETSFKMCMWVCLRHPLTYFIWQPFPLFYALGIPEGVFLLRFLHLPTDLLWHSKLCWAELGTLLILLGRNHAAHV